MARVSAGFQAQLDVDTVVEYYAMIVDIQQLDQIGASHVDNEVQDDV